MKESLKIRGFYQGYHGYHHFVRELVKQFAHQGITLELQNPPVPNPPSYHLIDPWFDTLSTLPVDAPPAKTVVHIGVPHQTIPVSGCHNIIFTMFEATPAPISWVKLTLRHDLIVVPSESSCRAWIKGGAPVERMRICPLGIDSNLYAYPAVPLPLLDHKQRPMSNYRYRFLNISHVGSRKNLTGLLRTWLRATSKYDDAILLLKVGIYFPMDERILQGYLREAQQTAGKPITESAPVFFVKSLLPDDVMPQLYRLATHYISLSHGEGWDMPMMEAGACGLDLIAPQHTSYPAYLDDKTAHFIPTHQVKANFIGDPYFSKLFESSDWWDPDEEAVCDLLRTIINGNATRKESPSARILREFSWERSAMQLLDIVHDLEQ